MTGLELKVEVDPHAPLERCRSCGQWVWWGKTARGKANPFDVTNGVRTKVTHFSTCPDAKAWSKKATP